MTRKLVLAALVPGHLDRVSKVLPPERNARVEPAHDDGKTVPMRQRPVRGVAVHMGFTFPKTLVDDARRLNRRGGARRNDEDLFDVDYGRQWPIKEWPHKAAHNISPAGR